MTAAPRGDASSLFATPRTVAEHRADGSIVLRSPEALRDGARCVGDWLEQWARQKPDTVFLAERDSADTPWATMTYAGALRRSPRGRVVDFGAKTRRRTPARDPIR